MAQALLLGRPRGDLLRGVLTPSAIDDGSLGAGLPSQVRLSSAVHALTQAAGNLLTASGWAQQRLAAADLNLNLAAMPIAPGGQNGDPFLVVDALLDRFQRIELGLVAQLSIEYKSKVGNQRLQSARDAVAING
ncbi:MAG: hypothetical protein VKL97_02315 [Cyanobacteriota bacterium]|nr:hypothetical protein [Cyanobacteriota bacterium]